MLGIWGYNQYMGVYVDNFGYMWMYDGCMGVSVDV